MAKINRPDSLTHHLDLHRKYLKDNTPGAIVEYNPKYGPPVVIDDLMISSKTAMETVSEIADAMYGFNHKKAKKEEVPFEEEMAKEREMFFNNE